MVSILYLFGSFIALYGWGRLVGDHITKDQHLNIGRYMLVGIFISIFIGQTVHLFNPLDSNVSYTWFFLGLLIVLFKFYNSKNKKYYFKDSFLLIFLIFILSGLAARGIMHYDSGLYHIQTIKWLQTEPIVLGLVNLHSRFAFNQTYFIFSSMVSPFSNPLATQIITNSIISFTVLTSLLSVKNWRNTFDGKHDFNAISIFTLVIISLIVVFRYISSLSPDFMLVSITLVTFAFFLFYCFDRTEKNQTGNIGLLILLLVLIPTIKLSGLFFSLTAILIIFLKVKNDKRVDKKRLVLPLVLGSILILIYLLRNVLFSGCLLYPVSATCLPFDWAASTNAVQHVSDTITSWARWPGHSKADSLNTFDWLFPWSIKFISNKYVILTVIFSAVSLYLINSKESSNRAIKQYLYILAPVFISMIFWFYKAPDIRFALVYFLMAIIWFYSVVILSSKTDKKRKHIYILFSILVLANIGNVRYIKYLYDFAPIPKENVKILTSRHGMKVLVPNKGDQCWDAPLPCAPKTEFKNDLKIIKNNIWYKIIREKH